MRRLVALLLLFVLVLVTACSGDDDDDAPDDGDTAPTTGTTGAPVLGGRLVVGLEDAITGLDPAGAMTVSELSAAYGVFDSLADLAASFEGTDDDTRWSIGLRPGITFSDGTPLDAAAVLAMFDRLLASPVTQPTLRPLRGVGAAGPMTVELTTDPWPDLGEVLAGPLGLVPSPTMVDSRHPIGTGPFTVGEITPGQPVVLTRNDSYWRSDDLPSLDELELRGVASADDRIAGLARGDLDVIHVSGDDAVAALGDADDVIVSTPDDSQRAVVALVNPDTVACADAVAGDEDAECDDDVSFTVLTDQPDEVVDAVVEDWEDDGFDVAVERVDAPALATDRLLADVEVLVTIDDGLPRGRLDGAALERRVIETIPWAYGTGPKVGGVGEVEVLPGVIVPASLFRTR